MMLVSIYVLQSSLLNVFTELKHEGEVCAMHHIPGHVCEETLGSDDSVGQLRKKSCYSVT